MSKTSAELPIPPLPQRGPFALVDLRTGRVHPLEAGPNVIGRSSKSRVVLDDAAVSRRHAVLMVHEDGRCEVGDAESRNGVFRNGRKLQDIARVRLGDVLRIDGFQLLLTRLAPGVEPGQHAFTDETLGVVVWNAADASWHFGIAFGPERFVPASFSPTDYTQPDRVPPVATPEWDAVRACSQQVKAHEAEARVLVGMLPLPHLAQVLFTITAATLVYEKPFSGTVCVSIDRAGTLSRLRSIPTESSNDD